MNKLDAWKRAATRDVELPSGTTVTVALTSVRDEIVAGTFTGPVLALARQMESNTYEPHELTEEELKAYEDLRHTLVSRSVIAVESEPVSLSVEDVGYLPKDDVDELWLYVMRLKKLPKAPTP